jgi:hypothetical protein
MTAPGESDRSVRDALMRADRECRRAERAAEFAERHEQQACTDPPRLREFHLRLAVMLRRVETQHVAAAKMHTSHAVRLRSWIDSADGHRSMPRLMASVAEAAGADGAAITLFGPGLAECVTAVSDNTAKAAQDAEFTFGEGPARDAMRRHCAVRATGTGLFRRWPNYGPAVARLGIRSIAAVPIDPAGVPLGTLTLFGPRSPTTIDNGLRMIADTVATMLLSEDATFITGDAAPTSSLLAEADHRAIIHQASGIVSVACGCSIPDALALIRARAFADDRPIESVASDIVARTVRLP